jgi:phosphoribosylformimino-5-aminoimidazole carboxamide ribotide isomerase
MTRFRPCIDLHEGVVKQVVGGSFGSGEDAAVKENFVSERPAAYYAGLYRDNQLTGGHVIMLGPGNEVAARNALATYPGGLQVGGGINPENAGQWLEAGASHVIVTSFIFEGASFCRDRLAAMVKAVGREYLVLDLSCRGVPGGGWQVAMNRWRTLTDLPVAVDTLDRLAGSCTEFLVHAADVEGKCAGVDEELVEMLGRWQGMPVTYAGGARSISDLERVDELSAGRVDLTVGSALDIFGGSGVCYADCVAWNHRSGQE